MELKTPLHPSSSRIDPHDHHLEAAYIVRFIVTITFIIGNALVLLPTSILRRDSSTFRSLALSVMLAFASAFVSLLLIHCNKAGFAERICRWTSMVAMAAVVASLLYLSVLRQW